MQKTTPISVLATLWPKFKYKAVFLSFISLLLLFSGSTSAQQPSHLIFGTVTTVTGKPILGATVKIKANGAGAITNENGHFSIKTNLTSGVLTVSFVSYKTIEKAFNESNHNNLKITLQEDEASLREVNVVSTGYQTLPKERATGSFVLIDSTLLNRKVGANILDRLDGVTSGLIFNRGNQTGNSSAISIRGRSTIFADPNPLIVLDNFPYDGDVNNINPNDIENITILKDAAAASIWGVRAGNGVIVITTKKGSSGDKVHISVNANTTFSNNVNLHYQPQMSSADYIDLEQYLLNKGYYNNTINDGYSTISPALAIMLQKKNGQISAADSTARIDQLKTIDARDQYEKYIYRAALNQQYSFSMNGGSKSHTYYISAGYDKDLQNTVANSYNRFTLNANNTYYLLNNKLQLFAGILLSTSDTKGGDVYQSPYLPYEQLADANGNHLAVIRDGMLRKQYTDTAGSGQLLDWNYRPLDETYSDRDSKLTDYKLNTNLKYNILASLSLSINYQYQKGITDYNQMYGADSYYTRNLINSFTQLNQATLVATRPVPPGAINYNNNSNYYSNYGRAQINYANKFGDKHDVNVIAGIEIKDYRAASSSNTMYGFNTSDASYIPVDYLTNFPQYYGSGTSQIAPGAAQDFSVDRFRSAFFNASYIYNDKYVLSVSARRDESNIFGVSANQKGVPLWSAGLMWNLSKEGFYPADQLPELKIRATYGYNGNLDRSTSAYLTAQNRGTTNKWNIPYIDIVNPPNPSLRWEQVKNINLGADFSFKRNLFSGSIDYYSKQGIDLIANSPIAAQSGVIQFKGNSANTKTSGVDFIFNKNSTGNTSLKWQSNFLFSYNKEIITNYKVKQGSNSDIVNSNYVNPLEGYPYDAIFSFKYLGLDHQGNPQGVLNGVTSEDYSGIINSTNASELVYKGSATPIIYGSYRNTFTYGGFDLSFNITYKLDYSFRRYNVFSGSSYNYLSSDYDKRWRAPGDELKTNIPALVYPLNSSQQVFFQGSDLLVENADHIRLQDIRLAYNFKPVKARPIFKSFQVYAYLNNVGIIWKATKQNLDPDYATNSFVNPRSFSIGLNINF